MSPRRPGPCSNRNGRRDPRRSTDGSLGRDAERARLAAASLDATALAALGLSDETLAGARRWRKAKWIDHALERLELLRLIDLRWDEQRLDERITLCQPRWLGFQVITSTCVPSVRPALDEVWDEMHQFGAGSFMCGPFLTAYYARSRPGRPR